MVEFGMRRLINGFWVRERKITSLVGKVGVLILWKFSSSTPKL